MDTITGCLEDIRLSYNNNYVVLRGRAGSCVVYYKGLAVMKITEGKDKYRWKPGLSYQIKTHIEKIVEGEVLALSTQLVVKGVIDK